MSERLLELVLKTDQDAVQARRRAREVAAALGLDVYGQMRLAAAVSELARNALQFAGGGQVELSYEDDPPTLRVRIEDHGPGIADLAAVLDGAIGQGSGLVAARRLIPDFAIESTPGKGTRVSLGKRLRQRLTREALARLPSELLRRGAEDPFEEIRQQNQELLRTLNELRAKQEELTRVNRELEDTNRGVVALYAELDEKAFSLERANEVKKRFLSNMSHEFRTPLASILSLSRLLLDRVDGPLSTEQERQVTFVLRAAQSLSDLVDDLLDLARVEAGKIRVRPAEFHVKDLFAALRGMFRPLLSPSSPVALVFEEPEGVPQLHTDEGKVSQVLRNLISNALKFTERGEVRVSARAGEGGTVALSVADTGIGIAPEHQAGIFEEFGQLDHPIQKRVRGTGLGLPLSKKLAELLRGRIVLESKVDVGSAFSLVIPATYVGPGEVSAVGDVALSVDPTRSPVLVVEDNRETVFLYEKYLQHTRFQVVSARSTAEARRLLARVRPVAIVLDILLDGESAWAFLSELKTSPATKDVPILVATVVENEEKARALGADAFCAKPMPRDWLIRELEARAARPPKRLLIVDDDEASRYVLRSLLPDAGFEIVEASDGTTALDVARRTAPAVVFLDVMMPGRSGFEVLEDLARDPATKDIPVVIYTSKLLGGDEQTRLAGKVAAILSKEVPSREVAISRVREALELAGAIGRGG